MRLSRLFAERADGEPPPHPAGPRRRGLLLFGLRDGALQGLLRRARRRLDFAPETLGADTAYFSKGMIEHLLGRGASRTSRWTSGAATRGSSTADGTTPGFLSLVDRTRSSCPSAAEQAGSEQRAPSPPSRASFLPGEAHALSRRQLGRERAPGDGAKTERARGLTCARDRPTI